MTCIVKLAMYIILLLFNYSNINNGVTVKVTVIILPCKDMYIKFSYITFCIMICSLIFTSKDIYIYLRKLC